jgi:hypothetical protein
MVKGKLFSKTPRPVTSNLKTEKSRVTEAPQKSVLEMTVREALFPETEINDEMKVIEMLYCRFKERASKIEWKQKFDLWQEADFAARDGRLKEWVSTTENGKELAKVVARHDLNNDSFTGAELVRVAKEVLL